MATAPNIFISYSHKDRVWLDRLREHFAPLARNALLNAWDDSRIKPGTNWRDEIAKALAEADIAVLLVTPAFLASDFIDKNELPPLLVKDHIFWIAVRHSNYEQTEIADYQSANDPAKPLASLSESDQDKVLVEICKKILAAVQNP
jgi:internalin A